MYVYVSCTFYLRVFGFFKNLNVIVIKLINKDKSKGRP